VTHGREVKGKLANGVGSQYSHTTSERGVSSITTTDAHTSAASIRLNWRPRRFKWTRPFWRKTKPGFCACAITFQTRYTSYWLRLKYNSLYGNILKLNSFSRRSDQNTECTVFLHRPTFLVVRIVSCLILFLWTAF